MVNGDGVGRRRAFRGLTPLCSLKVARASKISGRKFSAVARRKPTGLTSAKLAALKCNAAARTGFLLAALHSVAAWGQPSEGAPTGTARSPRASKAVCPHLPLLGKERTTARAQREPRRRVSRSFPPLGTHRDGPTIGNEAADRGGGGVRWGLRAIGDGPRRVVRRTTADSLCDRMERGEEKASTGRRSALQRSHFCRC
jgi:hypothetical protein